VCAVAGAVVVVVGGGESIEWGDGRVGREKREGKVDIVYGEGWG